MVTERWLTAVEYVRGGDTVEVRTGEERTTPVRAGPAIDPDERFDR